jgi:hypothetical protein
VEKIKEGLGEEGEGGRELTIIFSGRIASLLKVGALL